MELDDLKTTWKSIAPEMEGISRRDDLDTCLKKKKDVKVELLHRMYFEVIIMALGCIANGTSREWAYVKLPVWWICLFCLLLVAGIVATIYVIRVVRRINLGETPHVQVVSAILSIKKIYSRTEFYSCAAIAVLMLYAVFTPPFGGKVVDIAMVLVVTVILFALEYFWYRTNMRLFNDISEWIEKK